MSSKYNAKHTHYDVLQLPREHSSRFSKDDIKFAYRRALLLHHPDKASGAQRSTALNPSETDAQTPRYSVDDIVLAHETLSDPVQRADYDSNLGRVDRPGWKNEGGDRGTHVGVETFDLEDLIYNENDGTWSRSCRCGNQEGYFVTDSDLEKESKHGEIYVGCRGCSLFVQVHFAVEDT